MFSAFLKKSLDENGCLDITVENGGMNKQEVEDHSQAEPDAIASMKREYIDLSSHKPHWFGDFDLNSFDLFLCMEEHHKEKALQVGIPEEKIRVLNMPDPYKLGLEVYLECAKVLKQEAEKNARELC